jgi:two-component system sensor kinase FixL
MIELSTVIHTASCKLTVTDDGIGIPVDDQSHIFEPFFRAGNTTDIAGTGLGLSIIKRSVELLNGEVGFEGRPGATSFTITLPLARRTENDQHH